MIFFMNHIPTILTLRNAKSGLPTGKTNSVNRIFFSLHSSSFNMDLSNMTLILTPIPMHIYFSTPPRSLFSSYTVYLGDDIRLWLSV